jgi:threonine aldolase
MSTARTTSKDTPIDLRSDTVTRPTDAMRRVIANAEVGDDQYGEDTSTNRLQAYVAELLGKEAALWLPSGTMANQVALKVLTQPGDEVVVGQETHAVWHEKGASASNAGVQFREVGTGGTFTPGDFLEARMPLEAAAARLAADSVATLRNVPCLYCW